MQNREPAKRCPDSRLLPIGNPSRACCSAHGGGPDAAPAHAADVVSSNIVGYEKVSLSANAYYLSGIQFVKVGGEQGTLNDLFSATDIPYGTVIQFLNEEGMYDLYTYLEEAYDAEADDFVPGWGDGGEELVVDPTPPGTGFWIKSPENYELAQSGEVSSATAITLEVPAGAYTMISNPFPDGFNPNAVTWSDNLEYGTVIQVLNDQGMYDLYTYLEEAYDPETDDFVPGWGDGGEELVSSSITTSPAQGVWIKSDKAVTLTVTLPSAN